MSTITVTAATPVVELQTIPPAATLPIPIPRSYDATVAGIDETPLRGPDAEAESAMEGRTFTAAPLTTVERKSRFMITALIVVINIVQFMSVFSTIAGGLALSKDLGREVSAGQANWMAASFSLTQGAFVLITGRLGAIFGHQRLVLLGTLVFAICSFANAFCRTYDSFVAVRALTGIGAGMFMPNAVATITTMVPPGRSRNITMSFFASAPPIGGTLGGVMIGVFFELVGWPWLFMIIAGIAVLGTACLALLFPVETPVDRNGKIDFVGAFLGLGSLLLFNFVWNQAPAAGWDAPYEIACLILSVVMFCLFLLWEKKFAVDPIMPLNIFRTPTFTALIFVSLLTYMGVGICMWYAVTWQQALRHLNLITVGINFIPFGICSVASVGLAAWLIPRVAAQYIMAIGIVTIIAANLLLATMPIQQTYWAQVFPAITLSSFSPDFVYIAAQIIASNSVGRRHQGVAGSLIGTLNLYGNSLGLGFAGTIESQIAGGHSPKELVDGYRAALFFGVALATVGLMLNFAFVRMPKDSREGWDDSLEVQEDVVAHGSATAVDRPAMAS